MSTKHINRDKIRTEDVYQTIIEYRVTSQVTDELKLKYLNGNSMYLPYSMSPLETLEVKYVWPRKFIENKTFTKFYFRVVI